MYAYRIIRLYSPNFSFDPLNVSRKPARGSPARGRPQSGGKRLQGVPIYKEPTQARASHNKRGQNSIADYASQIVLNRFLQKYFPSDAVISEEDSIDLSKFPQSQLEFIKECCNQVLPNEMQIDIDQIKAINDWKKEASDKTRFWTIDPIDGTKGYLRGDQHCVCLALLENYQVTLGVLGCPNLQLHGTKGHLVYARLGAGAYSKCLYSDKSAVKLSILSSMSGTTDALAECVLVESVEPHSDYEANSRIISELGITKRASYDSQCKYALLAASEAGLYLRLTRNRDYKEKIWVENSYPRTMQQEV